jgi:hypothetical protein
VKTKDKRKPKRTRGQTMQKIDFLTPLSVDECVEHLKSGRSPLDNWQMGLSTDDVSQFIIGFVDNICVGHHQITAPVWIEGSLTEQ